MKIALLALPVLVAFGSAAYAAEGDASFPAACNADMQKYCASATTDEAKAECMAQNESKLSQACRTAMGGEEGEQPGGY